MKFRRLKASEIEWRPVPNYEGIYRVNNIGQIQNIKTGHYLKYGLNEQGYLRTFLYNKKHERKFFFVHRIVCSAFHDNPFNLPQVNHINMNKTDNRPENLEWCSQSYNIKHSFDNGRREHNKEMLLKATHKEVLCKDMNGKLVKKYFSLSEASRDTGCNVSNISACCHGRIKSLGGYKWELALEN